MAVNLSPRHENDDRSAGRTLPIRPRARDFGKLAAFRADRGMGDPGDGGKWRRKPGRRRIRGLAGRIAMIRNNESGKQRRACRGFP